VATAKKDQQVDPREAIEEQALVGRGTFEKPAATVKAEKQAAERAEEVADIQKEAFLRNHTNVPAGNVVTVYATPDGDKEPESITFSTDGNAITVVATAKEMVFNGQDALQIARAASQVGNTL
jgi:hypothetical protein